MPGPSAIVLAACSTLLAAFPIYFAYSWRFIEDEDRTHVKQNNSNYQVGKCLLLFASVCFRLLPAAGPSTPAPSTYALAFQLSFALSLPHGT